MRKCTAVKPLTFKQYLDSKERLRESITKVPIVDINYVMKKYCKFPVGTKEDKQFVPLKPNDVLKVTWKYTDPKTRLVEGLVFNEAEEGVFTYWRQEKLQKWIAANCIEMVD